MATLPERVSANEANIKTLFQRQREIMLKLDDIGEWQNQMIGSAKEAAKWASIRLAAAGLILTGTNIGISLFIHYAH